MQERTTETILAELKSSVEKMGQEKVKLEHRVEVRRHTHAEQEKHRVFEDAQRMHVANMEATSHLEKLLKLHMMSFRKRKPLFQRRRKGMRAQPLRDLQKKNESLEASLAELKRRLEATTDELRGASEKWAAEVREQGAEGRV